MHLANGGVALSRAEQLIQEQVRLFLGSDREVDELVEEMCEPGGCVPCLIVRGILHRRTKYLVSSRQIGRLPEGGKRLLAVSNQATATPPAQVPTLGLTEVLKILVQPRLTTRGSMLCDFLPNSSPGVKDWFSVSIQFQNIPQRINRMGYSTLSGSGGQYGQGDDLLTHDAGV